MFEILKSINWNIVVSILILLALWAANAHIQELPKMIRDMLKQTREYKSNHDLQIESYFRQVSNDELEKLLSKWTYFITDMDNAAKEMDSESGQTKLIELEHKTIMYGSPRTVYALAAMQHSLYSNNSNSYKLMMYMATVACSLKKDFTGYEISPVSLIEIKINDFDDYKKQFVKYYEEIQKEISEAEKAGYVK
ncbi:hypothetical protein H5S40_03425 [Limosilactobacillus sp. RRLNB_1_1]|uniref:Uncharacterized protein n=1 Tax=Limosilactobacillus albertensis TaxID=2759752 RepID=A0A7W3TQW2_9LACO|nr:hypothetical protein [Limosilactobacillus albertensis]MBB1069204.1 hypothetical protein [Limosilactobacillus albertensis]MCD7118498.1 hypothetical protein [Limosilactobacillus albertensis]MCD7128641.1 hypothetical protein [Limosilactobacillus albertensis]